METIKEALYLAEDIISDNMTALDDMELYDQNEQALNKLREAMGKLDSLLVNPDQLFEYMVQNGMELTFNDQGEAIYFDQWTEAIADGLESMVQLETKLRKIAEKRFADGSYDGKKLI